MPFGTRSFTEFGDFFLCEHPSGVEMFMIVTHNSQSIHSKEDVIIDEKDAKDAKDAKDGKDEEDEKDEKDGKENMKLDELEGVNTREN